jgi:hypothetical protein
MTMMAVYCARNCNTPVEREVTDRDVAGEIACLECFGTGIWDFMEPEVPAFPCVDCKGTGKQFVSL